MRRFFAVFLLACATTAFAQHPNDERGFSAERVYDIHDIDSINGFNGNLIVQIPIGPEYKVNGRAGYRLHLTYNSHIWRFQTNDGVYDPDSESVQVIAYPISSFNAGLGWRLSLGKLFEGGDPDQDQSDSYWIYQSDDGADHAFFGDPHTGLSSATVFPQYSRDNTYLRLSAIDSTTKNVEFPDGSFHTFRQLQPGSGTWLPSAGSHQWFLTAMTDSFGNTISVSYSTGTYPEIWTISDAGRTNSVYFVDTVLGFNNLVRTLDHVDTTAFGGATAQYRFSIQPSTSIPPALGDSTGRPYVPVALLTGITTPAGNGYSMMLNGAPAYDTSSVAPGELTRVTLPTLGSVGWTYDSFNMVGFLTPSPKRSQAIDKPVMVTSRTKYDATGASVGTWTYGRRLASRQPVCVVPCMNGKVGQCYSGRGRQLTEWVTEPSTSSPAKTTITYFSAYEYLFDPYGDTCPTPEGWQHAEHGLPFTRFFSKTQGSTTRFLSSEIRTGFDSSVAIGPNWDGKGKIPDSGTVLRETYVKYSLDCDAFNDTGSFNHNAALNSTVTYFDDDSNCGGATCFYATNHSGSDGFGHFRQTSTESNFPGSADNRTTFTNYNASLPSPSCEANPTPTPPASWLLTTLTEQCVSDETTARAPDTVTSCASLPAVFTMKTQFDSRGALIGKRTLKSTNGQLDPADVMTTYAYDAGGNVASEAYAGGEAQPIGTGSIFPFSPATYTITHALTYKDANNNVCSTAPGCTVTRDLSTYANGVVVADVESDRTTGLTSVVRDASGLATSYSYDVLNRVTSVSPPGVVATRYTYSDAASGSAFTPAKVLAVADAAAYGLGQVESEYQYDAFGRVWRVKKLLDGTSWSIVQNDYDAMGRKVAVSMPETLTVPENTFSPAHTIVTTFDPFDRPVSIQAPDATVTTRTYSGTRQLTRTANVGTGVLCPNDTSANSATTTEIHDVTGRLISVTERSGNTSNSNPCGTNMTTYYDYDAADHLTRVTSGAQVRRFLFDGRGFMQWEQHPELGQSGLGTISYVYGTSSGATVGYDARGHALAKLAGSLDTTFDIRFTYDSSERLTDVTDNGEAKRPVKHFDFYTATAGAGSNARLQRATRYNRLRAIAGDVVVSETYTYDAATGRPSHRDTAVQNINNGAATTLQAFGQNFTYDRLANLAQLDYPTCFAAPCAATPASNSVGFTRTYGYLRSVAGYASSLTYNPDDSIFQVSHTPSVTDTYTPDPNGMGRPYTISFNGVQAQSCGSSPSATVTGGGTYTPGGSAVTIGATLTGTAPWTVTWSDGLTISNINSSTTSRSVTPQTTTQYSITQVTDGTGCSNPGNGSATVTVQSCGTSPTANVNGGGTYTPGGPPVTIGATLGGTPPFTVTWSDGQTFTNITGNATSRSVAPQTTTQYSITLVKDATGCSNPGNGSVTVTVSALSAPTGLVATTSQTNTLQVVITWNAVTNAGWYQVQRATRITLNDWQSVGPRQTGLTYTDTLNATTNPVTYLYRVLAGVTTNAGDSLSAPSNLDYATVATALFPDGITAGVTPILGGHFSDLRRAIDAVRLAAGLNPAWTSYAPLTGPIVASDIASANAADNSMRYRLDEAAQRLVGHGIAYTDTPAQKTLIRRVNLTEMRDGVR